MARYVIINKFMGCGLWFYWMVKIWKEHDWKIDNKEIWERFMWIDFSEWVKKNVKISVFYESAH